MQCIQLAPYKGEESSDAEKVGVIAIQCRKTNYHIVLFQAIFLPLPWMASWFQPLPPSSVSLEIPVLVLTFFKI